MKIDDLDPITKGLYCHFISQDITDNGDFLSPLLKDFIAREIVSLDKKRKRVKIYKWILNPLSYILRFSKNGSVAIFLLTMFLINIILFATLDMYFPAISNGTLTNKNWYFVLSYFAVSGLFIILNILFIVLENYLNRPYNDYATIQLSTNSKSIIQFIQYSVNTIHQYTNTIDLNEILLYLLTHSDSRARLNSIFLTHSQDNFEQLISINFKNVFVNKQKEIKEFLSYVYKIKNEKTLLSKNLSALKSLMSSSEKEYAVNGLILSVSNITDNKSYEQLVNTNKELEEIIRIACNNQSSITMEYLCHLQNKFLEIGN